MRRAALLAALALAALPAPAHAARDLEVGMADDRLLQQTAGAAPLVAREWKEAGVDVARVTARWVAVAPGTHRTTPPSDFDADDPNDPRYEWTALDGAVDALRAAGVRVMLNVTGSGPLWSSREPRRRNPRWRPDPRRFAAFARAVARRYGDRVDRYLLWNEPNQAGWLQPQAQCRRGRCAPVAPHVYRELVLAAYPAIKRADPGAQVLMGQLAPIGKRPTSAGSSLKPIPFLQAMGCVDRRYQPLRDRVCRRFEPPTADAIGYHPHGKQNAPDRPNPDRDEAQFADLARLFRALDRLSALDALRPARSARFDLYLTEFAYQTSPPDRAEGVSLARQAAYLQQASYLAWRHPRIRNVTQYEWQDEPVRDLGEGPRAYAGWQSGLRLEDGRLKPAAVAFPNPFWIDRRPGEGSAVLWGHVRPGDAHAVTVERLRPSEDWEAIFTTGTSPRGFWAQRIAVEDDALYRYRYDVLRPDGAWVTRRSLALRPRASRRR